MFDWQHFNRVTLTEVFRSQHRPADLPRFRLGLSTCVAAYEKDKASAEWTLESIGSLSLFYVTSDCVDLAVEASRLVTFNEQERVDQIEEMHRTGRTLFYLEKSVVIRDSNSAIDGMAVSNLILEIVDGSPILAAFAVDDEGARYTGVWNTGKKAPNNLFDLFAGLKGLINQEKVTEVSDVAVRSRSSNRKQRKSAPKPSTVRVVDIRRSVKCGIRDAAEATRTYSVRWVVRGHWRNQACGPGRRQRRRIFVPPHVKGPSGAPIIQGEKVYKL